MKGIGSMKRLVMAMSALLVSVTMSFAQESSLHKEPFVVNVGQLVSYLELRPSQINEVGMINDYFREGNYIRLCTISKIIKGHMIMYPFIIQSFFSFFFPFPSFLTLQERVFRKRGSRGSVFGL